MERQQVLYDGEHRYDVILGEQALYTYVGGPEVIREQLERLLSEIDLLSLTLGILPATADVDMVPAHGFNMYDDSHAHYELVSTGVDISHPAELALHNKAFGLLSDATY